MNPLIIWFLLFNANVQQGTVKYYNERSGFGYIKSNNIEYFVYESGLVDEIKAGDKVTFRVVDTRKGLEAIEVRLK